VKYLSMRNVVVPGCGVVILQWVPGIVQWVPGIVLQLDVKVSVL
jgi:hypothetical protein